MEVRLNDGEQLVCRNLARLRHVSSREAGVFNARQGKQSDYKTDLEGIAGELAFAKAFDRYPSGLFELGARSSAKGEDDAGDITINGHVVDVKTTVYHTGKLIVAQWKNSSAIDYYALVIGTFPAYRIAGVMSSPEATKESRLGSLTAGGKQCYITQQSELECFSVLNRSK